MASTRWSQLGVAAGLTGLFLTPCFWQSRIASGDLASHVYNAWLALRILQGTVTGIEVTSRWNNVLFDSILTFLLPVVGVDWAQRLAVSLAVLVFVCGALLFIGAVNRRFSWMIVPAVGMLAYGFVFHAGFFNFYLSSGFCLMVLAILWRCPRLAAAAWLVPLAALALVAHPLPVVWCAAVAGFVLLARRIRIADRNFVTLGAFVAILGLGLLIRKLFAFRWQPTQLFLWSGADQAIVYGSPFAWFGLAWLVWGGFLMIVLIRRRQWPRISRSILFHLILVHAVALIWIPSYIQFPGYAAHFAFFSERMSLLQGVLACALLSRVPASAMTIVPTALLAVAYFVSLRAGDGMIVRFEDQVMAATASLSGFPRAVSGLCTPKLRLNYGFHLLDRACIGRCYSYGNYEPSSGQFRLRARSGNPYVVSDVNRAYEFEFGGGAVTAQELPLFRVEGSLPGEVKVRSLVEGEKVEAACQEP